MQLPGSLAPHSSDTHHSVYAPHHVFRRGTRVPRPRPRRRLLLDPESTQKTVDPQLVRANQGVITVVPPAELVGDGAVDASGNLVLRVSKRLVRADGDGAGRYFVFEDPALTAAQIVTEPAEGENEDTVEDALDGAPPPATSPSSSTDPARASRGRYFCGGHIHP